MAKVIQPGLFLPMWADKPTEAFPGKIWATPAVMHCGEEHGVRTQREVQCSGRELCRGLIVQHCKGTKEERKGSDVIDLPSFTLTVLWNLIRLVSHQCQKWNAILKYCTYCTVQFWGTLFAYFYFILLCTATPVQIREKSKIQTNRPSLTFSLNYAVWMGWIFRFAYAKLELLCNKHWNWYTTTVHP